MEEQRYRGARLQESDALVNPNDEQQATPSSGAADVTSAGPARQPAPATPYRAASTSPATSQPAPRDDATFDDQATLLAERQPGASAIGAPTPGLNGSGAAYSPHAAGPDDATAHDSPRQWLPPRVAQPVPPLQPPAGRQRQASSANVPWQAAESWGPVTFTIEATTAAGASYLFWWLSGLLIYFNERHNRFVRFHAMQSILLTGVLTVVGVIGFIMSALCGDLASATGRHAYATLGRGIGLLTIVIIVFPWLVAMIAAWTGNYLRLPLVGQYAERYAAPPIEPTPPPLY
ncbi:MAG TPA: hypothetical protein VJN88_11070 [Ktedonobacterales bacterium]|nr:hypothetical protein [Ktedonobacterales bacterium]